MPLGKKIRLLIPPLLRGVRGSKHKKLPQLRGSRGGKTNLQQTNSQLGLTLTEVLAAVVMVSIALAAMSPPLMIAMATRIQARRAEQAMNIARQEVERVRQMVEDGEYCSVKKDSCNTKDPTKPLLPPVDNSITIDQINQFSAPTAICTTNCTAKQAFKEYVENDYFLVQVFRTQGSSLEKVGPNKTNQTVAFRLGVRVYHKVAEKNLGSLEKDKLDVVGVTNNQAGPSKAPLVVLYADLVRPNLDRSLEAYEDLLD